MKKYSYILTLFVALLLTPMESAAQKLVMGFIYPAGGSQGSTVDVEIGGLNLKDATSVLVSGDGITAEIIPLPPPEPVYIIGANGKKRRVPMNRLTDQSAPQLASRLGVRLKIAAGAEVGLRDLRLQSSKGVSNQLSFEVSQYPNYIESQKIQAGEVNEVGSLPATICGYVKPGEIDRFSFSGEAGAMLVAEVKGRAFVPYIADAVPGWFQPVIRLLDSKGREVAFADDYHTSPDPVMRVKLPRSDKYTLTINDAIFRGRQDFNYRIQLGVIPFVEGAFPLIAKVGERSTISLTGVNLKRSECSVKPTEVGVNYLRAESKAGELSNAVPYYVVDKSTKVVMSPAADFQLVEGSVIYDYITTPYEQRSSKLPLAAGESVVIDALARRIDSRADLRIMLLSPDGKVVAESDDVEDSSQGLMTHHADPVVSYKATAAGEYTILIEDIQGRAGKDRSYILRRMKPSAPFEAFVSPANITLSQGGTATFNVNFDFKTKKGVGGVGRIELDGLPADYKVSRLIPGRFPRAWEVSVTAPKDAAVGSFPIDVKILTFPFKGEKEMAVSAKATDNMTQAFYYIHKIPAAAFTAEIVPAIPYSVHFEPAVERDLNKPIYFSKADSVLPIKIRVDRKEGFNDELELALSKKLRVMTLDPVKLAAGESEKVIYIKLNRAVIDKMKFFRVPICVTATVNGEIQKQGQRTFVNAKYKDMTPIVYVMKEGTQVVDPYRTQSPAKKSGATSQKTTTQAQRDKAAASRTKLTGASNAQSARQKAEYNNASRVGSTSATQLGSEVAPLEINTIRDI